jgi:DNA-binding MarR family transcriptional regulator
MKLEEAIKQPKFKNEYQKAGLNIIYTASWISLKQGNIFKKHELTPEQYNVLRILRGQYPNPATVNLIIERMLDKSSNASRLVEKLRIKSMVERIQCTEDRRAVNVLITEKGLKVLEDLDQIEDKFSEGIRNLTKEEAKTLNNLLDKIRS